LTLLIRAEVEEFLKTKDFDEVDPENLRFRRLLNSERIQPFDRYRMR
jgi:hypothetical protein